MDIKPKTYYIAQLRVMLGGRAAEEVVYGKDNVTTGASSIRARLRHRSTNGNSVGFR